jgi:hypothetical protein
MSADEIVIEYRTNKENELKDMQAWKRFLQEIKYDPKTATAEYIDNNGKKSRVAFRIGRGLYGDLSSNGTENDKTDHVAYSPKYGASRITMIPHKGYKVGDYLQAFKHEASHVNQFSAGINRENDVDLTKLHSQKMLNYTKEFIRNHPELSDHDSKPEELLADLSAVITQGSKSWKREMLKAIKEGPIYAKNQGKLSGKRFNEDNRRIMHSYDILLTALDFSIDNRKTNKAKVKGTFMYSILRKYGDFYKNIVYQLDHSDLKNDRSKWSNEFQKLDSNIKKSIERFMEILSDNSKEIPINNKENLKKKGVYDRADYRDLKHKKELTREINIIRKNANAMMTIVLKHGGYGFDPNSKKRKYQDSYKARLKFIEQALKDKPWQESYADDNNIENMYCECLLEELDCDDDEIFIEEFIDECISSFEAYSENVEISW